MLTVKRQVDAFPDGMGKPLDVPLLLGSGNPLLVRLAEGVGKPLDVPLLLGSGNPLLVKLAEGSGKPLVPLWEGRWPVLGLFGSSKLGGVLLYKVVGDEEGV